MKTKTQIQQEIAELKALKPVGPFAAKTARSIKLAVEELEFGVDQTAAEWDELTDEQRDIVSQTAAWREGFADRPSTDWGSLVEPVKRATKRKKR